MPLGPGLSCGTDRKNQIDNTTLLFSTNAEILPGGSAGELKIAGVGLARGGGDYQKS